jgi:hypothetical protein
MKKIYFSSHKLPKQQSTNFWSQGILGVKGVPMLGPLCIPPSRHLTPCFEFAYQFVFCFIFGICKHNSLRYHWLKTGQCIGAIIYYIYKSSILTSWRSCGAMRDVYQGLYKFSKTGLHIVDSLRYPMLELCISQNHLL